MIVSPSSFSREQLLTLQKLVQANSDRSEIDKMFMFSPDVMDRVSLFCYCYRFLQNVVVVVGDGVLMCKCEAVLDACRPFFLEVSRFEGLRLGVGSSHAVLFCRGSFNRRPEGFALIDLFSVLLERGNLIEITKLKGVYSEGKGGDLYRKVVGGEKVSKEPTVM